MGIKDNEGSQTFASRRHWRSIRLSRRHGGARRRTAPQPSLADGKLADVAPTMLALIGLPQPAEMTGHSLLSETARAVVLGAPKAVAAASD